MSSSKDDATEGTKEQYPELCHLVLNVKLENEASMANASINVKPHGGDGGGARGGKFDIF